MANEHNNELGKSVEELESLLERCDNLILISKIYLSLFDGKTMEDLPVNIQEEYMAALKDLNNIKLLRRKLVLVIAATKGCMNIDEGFDNAGGHHEV